MQKKAARPCCRGRAVFFAALASNPVLPGDKQALWVGERQCPTAQEEGRSWGAEDAKGPPDMPVDRRWWSSAPLRF
ncbi:hypothetical protein HMPREF0262_03304 [Clostridium sp. ATCC 29733]|nr:hypothetical protein HMPREF0262_03304 [Clostridium sp. ATCC 29733]